MTRPAVLSAIFALPVLALAACGGGSGGGTRIVAEAPAPAPRVQAPAPVPRAQAPAPRAQAPAPAPEAAPPTRRRPVSTPDAAPLQLSPVEVQTAAPEMTATAAVRAASSRPRFGSVTQSSNRDAHSVTTDSASAAFANGKLVVQVRRQGKSALSFDAANATHDTGLRTDEGRRSREWGFVTATLARSSTAFARVEYDPGDATDWIVGGSWLAIEGNVRGGAVGSVSGGGAVRSVEVGAFVDGPEYSGGAPKLPTGDVSFSGSLRGTYSVEHGRGDRSITPGSIEIGEVGGTIRLTANMADTTIGGSIEIGGLYYGTWGTLWDKATGVRRNGRAFRGNFDLGSTFYSAGGVFTGAVSVPEAVRSSGAWGGKFSNVTGSGSNPRGAAGTVGVDYTQANGTRTSFVAYWDARDTTYRPAPTGPRSLSLPSGAVGQFSTSTTTITIPTASTTTDSEGNRYKIHGTLRFVCVGTGECVVTVTRDSGGAVTATFTGPAARAILETEAAAIDTHNGVVSALETIVGNANTSFGSSGGDRTHTAGDLALGHMSGIASRYSSLPARNSVSLAHQAITDHHRVAGWMTHSMFHLSAEIYRPSNPLHGHTESRLSYYSIGDSTGANPTGAFTWSGAAVAVDNRQASATYGRVFIGNAMLDIDDASNPDLDVSISGLTRHDGTETLADVSWSDLTMTNGAFDQAGVRGYFYGPNAEEVTGVFLSSHSVGVFGAKRP